MTSAVPMSTEIILTRKGNSKRFALVFAVRARSPRGTAVAGICPCDRFLLRTSQCFEVQLEARPDRSEYSFVVFRDRRTYAQTEPLLQCLSSNH